MLHGVGIVPRVRAVAYYKDLDEVEKPHSVGEGSRLIPVYLVEGVLQSDVPFFQLAVHERQAVYKDCDVIPVFLPSVIRLVYELLDYLAGIAEEIFLVDELYIVKLTPLIGKIFNAVFLDDRSSLFAVEIGKNFVAEPVPIGIRKTVPVQPFNLFSQVSFQAFFVVKVHVVIAEIAEGINKFLFKLAFGLVLPTLRLLFQLVFVGQNSGKVSLAHKIEGAHLLFAPS